MHTPSERKCRTYFPPVQVERPPGTTWKDVVVFVFVVLLIFGTVYAVLSTAEPYEGRKVEGER